MAGNLPKEITQLHTHDYRNPQQLPVGAVLIVGTGQSGGQIAEELHDAGREVHLAVSTCPEAPRRYRGHDILYWLLETGKHGPDVGIKALTREALPSPAARFACNPLLSGTDGGHDIHLRELGRRGMHLHGRLENIDDGDITFSDDLPERLATVEQGFNQRMRKAIDGYITAARLDAPDQPPACMRWGYRGLRGSTRRSWVGLVWCQAVSRKRSSTVKSFDQQNLQVQPHLSAPALGNRRSSSSMIRF